MIRWLARVLCGLSGHRWIYIREPDRLSVRCLRCLQDSADAAEEGPMRPSPAFLHRLRALEDEFRRADPADGAVQFNMWFTEAHMLDLASGYVPADVRAAMLAALDWAEKDKRRAARPVQKARKRRDRT